MSRDLALSSHLSLPLDVVTQKLAWLGVTGGGKTYAAMKLAELLWHAGAQFIVIDPVGVWYGLRLAKDGKRPSDIRIPIFGGLHADVPLEPTAGALVANLVVDRGTSAIIDVSQFESDAQKARFATDFADRFFFRKKSAPSAVHLFIEECQEFVPQNTMKGEERMLHAFTRLQKLGRNFGIGSSYISQRPQEVNKKALNMAQTLFVFRTTGVTERTAIEKWIEDKALDQDIAQDLPKLATGDCHVWSPEFLRMSRVVRIGERKTFDASATPEVGVAAVARELAPIDLDKLRADMAATIERAKADDPDELRKVIAGLRKELKTKAPDSSPGAKAEAMREARAEWKSRVDAAESALAETKRRMDRMKRLYTKAVDALQQLAPELAVEVPVIALPAVPVIPQTIPRREQSQARAPRQTSNGGGSALPRGERAILTVLATYPNGKSRRALGTLSGYASNGGSFGTYISRLRTSGYIAGTEPIRITEEGLAALGDFEPLPRGEELQQYWLGKLGKGEAAILRVLLEQYPREMTREELGRLAGYEASGGSFGTYLSRLRTKEVIHERELRASEAFFESP